MLISSLFSVWRGVRRVHSPPSGRPDKKRVRDLVKGLDQCAASLCAVPPSSAVCHPIWAAVGSCCEAANDQWKQGLGEQGGAAQLEELSPLAEESFTELHGQTSVSTRDLWSGGSLPSV